jgi:hypothetical protein
MLTTLIKIVKRDKDRKITSRDIKAIRKRIERDARPTTLEKQKHTIFLHEVGDGVHLYI